MCTHMHDVPHCHDHASIAGSNNERGSRKEDPEIRIQILSRICFTNFHECPSRHVNEARIALNSGKDSEYGCICQSFLPIQQLSLRWISARESSMLYSIYIYTHSTGSIFDAFTGKTRMCGAIHGMYACFHVNLMIVCLMLEFSVFGT